MHPDGEILGGKPAISELINRTFSDAGPNQWLRELVKNGFDADADNILVTAVRPDIEEWGATGVKVAVVDDGHGMTESDGREYLGDIFNGKSSLETNFHVGARVSVLPINHAGMLIASWTKGDDEGWMMWISHDQGVYVCRYLGAEDECGITAAAYPWLKHPLIEKAGQGTVVVLLGNSPEDHTFGMIGKSTTGETVFPTELPTKAVFTSYLSTVFWNSPNPKTSVRASYAGSGSMGSLKLERGEFLTTESGSVTPVASFGDLLISDESFSTEGMSMKSKYVKDSGTITLTTEGVAVADVHWALLHEKAIMSKGKNNASEDLKQYAQFPLFGELYQGELYGAPQGARRGVIARHKLERYGIDEASVRSRIALVVEPFGHSVTPSQGRGRLLPGNGETSMPHDDWGYLFRTAMPQTIREELDKCRGERTFSPALEKATAEISDLVNEQLGCYIKDSRSKRNANVAVPDANGDASNAPLPPGGSPTGTGTPSTGTSDRKPSQQGRSVINAPARKAKKAYEPPVVAFTEWYDTDAEPDLGKRMVRIEPFGDTYLVDLNRAHPLYRMQVDRYAKEKTDPSKFEGKLEDAIVKEIHGLMASALSMARSVSFGTWTQKLSRMGGDVHEAMVSNLVLSPYNMQVRSKGIRA